MNQLTGTDFGIFILDYAAEYDENMLHNLRLYKFSRVWYAQIFRKITLSVKFVLPWRPRGKMATKRGSFPGLNLEREVAKPVFECGGSC